MAGGYMSYPGFIPLSSDEQTSFICEWGQCTHKPVVYLLFGCLDQHLGELILCHQHTDVWKQTIPSMRCGCGEPIDMCQPVQRRDIHPTWLTTLLRDQAARRAGKYLSGVGVPTTVNVQKLTVLPQAGGSISPTVFTPRGNGKWKSMQEMHDYYKWGRKNRA